MFAFSSTKCLWFRFICKHHMSLALFIFSVSGLISLVSFHFYAVHILGVDSFLFRFSVLCVLGFVPQMICPWFIVSNFSMCFVSFHSSVLLYVLGFLAYTSSASVSMFLPKTVSRVLRGCEFWIKAWTLARLFFLWNIGLNSCLVSIVPVYEKGRQNQNGTWVQSLYQKSGSSTYRPSAIPQT